MGLSASKIGKHISEEKFHEGSIPTTPMLTPKIEKVNNDFDPRSPSANISRTPLEILSAAAKRLQNLEENEPAKSICSSETPLKAKPFVLGIDPRSPTTDFTRTPIVLNASENVLPRMVHNKNLNKVRLAEINMSPTHKTDEPSTTLLQTKSPILLGSSPIKRRTDTYKRKSLVGLLETNIDFTETDLDDIQKKCTMMPEGHNPLNHECKDENLVMIEVKEAVDEELSKGQVDINSDSENIEQIVLEAVAEESSTGQANINSDSGNNEQTPNDMNEVDSSLIQCDLEDLKNQSLDGRSCEESYVQNAADTKNNEETELNIMVANSREAANELLHKIENDSESSPESPPIVNITANVKELDQKLTNLIYEDDIIVCPRIVKLKEPIERSPLKNRNGGEHLRLQKLKVSDKPRKAEYLVSKIPVFKEKGKKEFQCENTPPRKQDMMRKGKVKKCNWDNTDTTLYL